MAKLWECWWSGSLLTPSPEWHSSLPSCIRKTAALGIVSSETNKPIFDKVLFSSVLIVICYYSVFLILFIFNIIFNKDKLSWCLYYWVGKKRCENFNWIFKDITITGVFINSLTSILTFNTFSFLYLSKDSKISRPPEGTLVKQMIHSTIFLLINIG